MTALSEADYRHLSTLPGDSDSSQLAETIRLVSNRDYADQLAAVTSMGHLGLTTALSWDDGHHHWQHPRISIGLTPERKIALSYNPGGERNPQNTASRAVATPDEAADYVDVLMNRMAYDTATVVEAIDQAERRKEASGQTRTEQVVDDQSPTRPGVDA